MPLDDPGPERRARRPLLVAGQLLLTGAVTLFILRQVGLGLDELRALDPGALQPRWGTLALSCLVLGAGYVVSAAIWRWMVAGLGGPRLSLLAASEVYLVANLGRYLPGKLWQIAGLAVLGRRLGVPASVSTAAAVLGQALALGGAALVGSSTLWARGTPLGGWSGAFVAALGALLAVALIPPLQRRAIALWFRLARQSAAAPDPGGGRTLFWLGLYTLNWAIYAGAFLLLVRSFGLPGPALLIGSAFAAAYVLGYAALFAPAGIGVREGFLVLFLSPAMGPAQAGAVSVAARVWTTLVELAPAAALWALRPGTRAGPPGAGEGAPASAPPAAGNGGDV